MTLAENEKDQMAKITYMEKADAANKSILDMKRNLRDLNGTFSEGVNRGLRDYYQAMKTVFDYGKEIVPEVAGAFRDTFNSVFKDIRTGEMKKFQDYFIDFGNKILDIWQKMLTDMLTNWITTGDMMKNPNKAGSDITGGLFGLLKSGMQYFFPGQGPNVGAPGMGNYVAAPGPETMYSGYKATYGEFGGEVNGGIMPGVGMPTTASTIETATLDAATFTAASFTAATMEVGSINAGTITGGGAGGAGGGEGGLSSLFGGEGGFVTDTGEMSFFANGGDFPAGKRMMVGERGPEIIKPDFSGTVIPNHMLQGGSQVPNFTMNVENKSDAQVQQGSQSVRYDTSMKQFVITTVLENKANYGPMYHAMNGGR
jgi:hypothetical protein